MYEFYKNHPRRGAFHNVNLSNLENVLRTDRAGECILREFRGTNFENFSDQLQPWWRLCGLDVCTGLLKKTLDTSLHNSSVLFHLKLYMFWIKGAHQSASIQTFDCSQEN